MFLSKKFASPLAAVLAASALSLASSSAVAAVVCNNTGLAVPATGDGIYVNLVTGATGTTGSSVSGWDFNLYAFTGGEIALYVQSGDPNNAVVWDGTELFSALDAGTPIGPASAFTGSQINGANQMSPWQGGVNRYLGLRFTNEANSTTTYAWVNLTTTGPGGFPANIVSWCYDNTGAAINAGTTPVSLQTYSVD